MCDLFYWLKNTWSCESANFSPLLDGNSEIFIGFFCLKSLPLAKQERLSYTGDKKFNISRFNNLMFWVSLYCYEMFNSYLMAEYKLYLGYYVLYSSCIISYRIISCRIVSYRVVSCRIKSHGMVWYRFLFHNNLKI